MSSPQVLMLSGVGPADHLKSKVGGGTLVRHLVVDMFFTLGWEQHIEDAHHLTHSGCADSKSEESEVPGCCAVSTLVGGC